MDNKKDTEYKTGGDETGESFDYFVFLIQKTEKLSSAVYLVTSLVSDMEPIKWAMRERSVALLSDISVAERAPLSDRMELFESLEEGAREMSSLLSIARAGRIVSSMNADILIAGFTSLREAISQGTTIPTSAETIVSELLKGDTRSLLGQPDLYKGQKDSNTVSHGRNINHSASAYKRTEDSSRGHFHTQKYPTQSLGKMKAERRKVIVDFIKKRKEVTIKDVLQVVSGCSEKTIQRELITLVKDNVLKKEGERRWSRYSLK